ncbi:MAG: hypothetical protein KDA99_27240 [Planctomycetales bacterium]|nr:hypothetical protein [Planctomycetales bacterium]
MYDRYGSKGESAGGGPGGGRGPGGPGKGGAGNYGWGTSSEDIDFSDIFGQRFGDDVGTGGFTEIFKQFTRGSGGGPFGSGGRGRAGQSRAAQGRQKGADIKHTLSVSFVTSIQGGEAHLNVQRPGGKVERLSVKIPAGIEDGKKIRVREQGDPSPNGGPSGDILITVRVVPHSVYQRKGDNLEIRVPLTLREAVEGTTIDLPTPNGTISLKIPPWTSSNKRLRVKGHGVRNAQGGIGDLYAEVYITLPDKKSDAVEQVVRQLEQDGAKLRADLHW